MHAEHWPKEPIDGEVLPQRKLMKYFQGQFIDAIMKEQAENIRDLDSLNGTFIQRVALYDEHELARGSRKIIMKPPHPADLPGFFVEVFALRFDEAARDEQHLEYITQTKHYLVRDFVNGRPGPYFIIDDDGARLVDVTAEESSFYTQTTGLDILDAMQIAGNMLRKYSGYNIVATAE